MTTTTAAKLIAVARGEIGYHEGRAGGHWNNAEKYAAQVPGLAWANYQAWCATFVSWCFVAAGLLKLLAGGPTASTDASLANWKRAGRFSEYPAIGAVVIYGHGGNPDHTGIVVDYGPDTITVVEGNTNDNGSREGDGVYLKTRQRRDPYVIGYGYPDFPEGIVSADPAWAHAAPKPDQHPHAPAAQPVTRGPAVDAAIDAARGIKGGPVRRAAKRAALKALRSIPTLGK